MRHIPRWAFMIMANCRRLVQISKQANDGKVPRDYVHKGVPFNLVQYFSLNHSPKPRSKLDTCPMLIYIYIYI